MGRYVEYNNLLLMHVVSYGNLREEKLHTIGAALDIPKNTPEYLQKLGRKPSKDSGTPEEYLNTWYYLGKLL